MSHGLLSKLRTDLNPSTIRGNLVRSALSSVLIKALSGGLAFLASLLYARVLGPELYGAYAYVMAWVAVLTVLAGLGVPKYLVKLCSQSPGSHVRLLHWGDRWMATGGLVAAALLATLALLASSPASRLLLLLAAAIPLLSNLGLVRQSLLQANGFVARSQWAQRLLAPVLVLLAMLAIWLAFGQFSPVALLAATLSASALALLVNQVQWRRVARRMRSREECEPKLRDALHFVWLGAMYLILNRTDILMLGALSGTEAAGIYAVSVRAAEAVLIVGMAANMAAAPRFARFHSEGNLAAVERLLRAMAWRVLLLTVPLAGVLVLFAEQILGFLYGSAYAEGATVLRILGLAQLFVVAGGSLGTVLNMTGHERAHMRAVSLAVAVNVVMNALLIPHFGAEGAAVATCCSVIVCRLVMQYQVRRRLGFRSPVFGI
ncbi:MAG TPA: flippase [Xanthomonadaceae bacterium]|nr:flippase [Xanthomonadaceae bacterium]